MAREGFLEFGFKPRFFRSFSLDSQYGSATVLITLSKPLFIVNSLSTSRGDNFLVKIQMIPVGHKMPREMAT